jgi:hypothetical protein
LESCSTTADGKFWDYLAAHGTYELAAAFSRLFWPEFVEVEGCVLLAEKYDAQNFVQWQHQLAGDRHQLEAVINHLHVYDLFPNDPGDHLDQAVLEDISQTLLRCWQAALHEAFPGKRFAFTYRTKPEEYGPTLSFHQVCG